MSETRLLKTSAARAMAFRLQRQHLTTQRAARDRDPRTHGARRRTGGESEAASVASVEDVVRDSAGIQAQVQSSAELSIWTRSRQTTRDDIRRALWETRDVVKTSAMRLTLHLIPARDLAVYIAALQPMAMGTLQRWHARVGANPAHVRAMIDAVVDSLADGPLTQQQLIARAKKGARKGVRAWFEHAWSAVRPAVIEGAIVYGPSRGAEATFVRTDAWLGAQPMPPVDEARAELFRRFLGAFGPATAHDFAKWSGLKVTEARGILERLRGELLAVSVDGATGWIRAADEEPLRRSALDEDALHLLGPFDSFLLAHATKEHLLDRAFYKRVYRPQGWISAVVLRGGRIIGVWTQLPAAKATTIDVQLFRRTSAGTRAAIESEVEALGAFLRTPCQVRFSAPN